MKDGRAARLLLAASVLLILPAALLLLHSNKFALPTAQWDGTALDAVLALGDGTSRTDPYLIHPPLYLHLLAFFKPLLGADLLAGARLVNSGCYLLTGWVIFLLGASLADEKNKRSAGIIAALLYFTSPLALQGVFLLDLGDTSLIPLAAGLFFLYGCGAGAGWFKTVVAGLLFSVNLWSKFIHSLFIVAAAFAAWVWDRKQGDILALLAGTIFFLISWSAYAVMNLEPGSRWTPIWYFFHEMILGYQARSMAGGFGEAVFSRLNSMARIMVWIWPLLLAWGARLYSRGLGAGRERYFNFFLIIFLAVSALSKGTSNGFPKYHAVALPLLCSLGGAYLAGALAEVRFSKLPVWLLALGAAVWAGLALAGDPLYTLNYSVRAALISGTVPWPQELKLLGQFLAAGAAFVALFYAVRRLMDKGASAAFVALAGALLWSTAVGFQQARADYFTTYGYGTRGKAEVVSWLAANKGGAVLGPNEFDWELKAASVPFLKVSDLCTSDRGCVLSLLRDGKTSFFVFGQASNTVGQVKDFLSLTEKDLERGFTSVKIGDFWIYSLGRRRA